MRHSGLLVLALAAGCIASDADLTETEQAEWDGSDWDPEGETIVIEGEAGWGWDAGWWFPGPGNEGTVEPPVPDGGGGGPGGGPGPKPERKVCRKEMGEEKCLDCCLYNNIHVDGWECNRKRTKEAKRRCWEEANKKLSECQVIDCDRHGIRPGDGILTSGGVLAPSVPVGDDIRTRGGILASEQ